MNDKPLARLYDRLTIWERIPLLLAAEARGDEAEHRRLVDSSPLRTWRASEHLLAEQALHLLALIYVGEQLDAAASYFYALWQLDDADDPRPEDWLLLMIDVSAYFFTANAEAWRRFCRELDIAADALTAANHQGWFLPFCEERMPAHAPTAEAVQARLRKAGRDVSQLVTADRLLARWRSRLRAMTRHAPPDNGKGDP
jgi:hypothetical protein